MTLSIVLSFFGSIGYTLKYIKQISMWSSTNIIYIIYSIISVIYFNEVCALLCELCVYIYSFSLNHPNTTLSVLIVFSVFILIYINYININFSVKYPNMYNHLTYLCVVVIISCILFLTFNLSKYLIELLGKYLVKINGKEPDSNQPFDKNKAPSPNNGKGGPGGSSNSATPSSSKHKRHESTEDNSSSRKVRPKPNLSIKIGPQTDIEKDNDKISKCAHDSYSSFQAGTTKDVNDTFCDFNSDSTGKQHKAFDTVGDNVILCKDCLAVICKNCLEDYSSESE